MAKKEEIQSKNLKENNKILSEQISLAAELADKFRDVYSTIKEKSTLDKISNDVLKQALKTTQNLKSEFNSIKEVQNDIVKAERAQNDVQKQILAVTEKGGKTLEKELDILKKREASLTKAEDKAKAAEKAVKAGVKGAKEQLDIANANLEKKRAMYDSAIETIGAEAEMITYLEEQNQQLTQSLSYLKEQETRQKNLANASKGLVNNMERVGKVLDKIGLGGIGSIFTDAAKKAKDMAYELTDGGKKGLTAFQKMKVAATALGGALKVAMGPMAIIGLLVSQFNKFKERAKESAEYLKKIDQQTVDLSRNLGVSSTVAGKVAGAARGIGAAMGMTSEMATQSATAIYNQLGGVEKLSGSTLKTFMKLNVHGGVTAETLGKVHQMAKLTGQEAGKVAERIATTAQSSIRAMKVNVSMKQVMEGVANTSSRVKLQFGGSADAITKAVVQSKKLGLEMDKVESIANSLLNIEDSIAAEMEAELLTGKELNLEKAREAALNGKNEDLMAALAEQGINAAEFSKMNRIQQDALAKSIGLSGDEMANMLVSQKENEASNNDLLDTQKQGIAAMTSMASLAEQMALLEEQKLAASSEAGEKMHEFEKAMLKLQTAMAPLIDNLFIPILDLMTLIVDKIARGVEGFANARKEGMGFMEALGQVWEKADGLGKTIGIIGAALVAIKATMIGINIAQKIKNGYDFIALQLAKSKLGTQELTNAELIKEGRQMIINGAKAALNFTKTIGTTIMKVIGSLASIPVVGVGLGIAAAATVAGLAAKYMSDGVISPKSGNSGFGDRVLYGPEGAISFNNKDTIVAGTNLFGNDVASGPDAGQATNGGGGAVVAELQRVSALLQQILGKEGVVMIDGNKVGTTLALANYKQQ